MMPVKDLYKRDRLVKVTKTRCVTGKCIYMTQTQKGSKYQPEIWRCHKHKREFYLNNPADSVPPEFGSICGDFEPHRSTA